MADEQNKSEKPTPHKLKEAKKQGQVAKSQELNLLVTSLTFLAIVASFLTQVSSEFTALFESLIILSHDFNLNRLTLINLFSDVSFSLIVIFVPLALLLLVFGISFSIMQTGFVLTAVPIKPDFKRMNPASGFKKIFSKKTMFEFIKSILKLIAIGITLYISFPYFISDAQELFKATPDHVAHQWQSMFLKVGLAFILLSTPLVILDFWFTRWDFTKKMMMSHRDLKDENKKHEGDPEVRSKQKQIQNELLQKSAALSQVKDSDVLITNPTHIAIALKYDKDTMVAPKVMAAGKGEFALKIRKQARKHSVPMVQNKLLARQLYKEVKINGVVPASCFNELAPIFRKIFGMEQKK